MIYLASLLVMPYLAFVFFGETILPVPKPRTPARLFRWRYGWKMAFAMFFCMVCANALFYLFGLGLIASFAIGGIMFLLLGIYLHKKRVDLMDSLL